MKLPAFDYACPATLAEAVALLGSRDEAKALAGGQSLVPMMAFRIASPSLLVDLRKLADLRQIAIDASGVRLGAMGIGDRPVRLADAEAEVNGKVVDVAVSERAGRAASASVSPQSDIHASGAYRKSLVGTMVERALQSAAGLPCR